MRVSVRWRGILRTVAFHAAFGLIVLAGSSDITRGAEPETGASILQQLRSLANTGSVLLRRRASRRREHAGHHLPGARTRIPDGVSLAHPRRRRTEPARTAARRSARRGAHPGAARRASAGRRTAVLHAREGLRVTRRIAEETLRDLGPAASSRRHRAGDPRVPAGRDHHAVLPEARADARSSHRLRRPRRRSVHDSPATPRRFPSSSASCRPVAGAAHRSQCRQASPWRIRRRRAVPLTREHPGRPRCREDRGRRHTIRCRASRLRRSPRAAAPCTRPRASASVARPVARGLDGPSRSCCSTARPADKRSVRRSGHDVEPRSRRR